MVERKQFSGKFEKKMEVISQKKKTEQKDKERGHR